MILVMSLLEMKQDNTVVKRIFRQVPMNILKENMVQIYTRYKRMYGEKYQMVSLNHGWENPDELDPHERRPTPYYECIIETGFYIYFLISHYLELDLFDTEVEIKNEMEDIKKEI